MSTRRTLRFTALLCAGLLASLSAGAAPPVVPATLSYQGLLLDAMGQPRTGSVNLTVRLYDSLLFGTLVYKQSFASVPLADGVFSVQLGPAGDAADVPVNPLTTSLATALAGDAGPTAPERFLEVTVGSEGALARTQVLSSAYALRAASADSADTAVTARDANSVGGLPASFVTELFQHFNADGGGPANDDSREGLGDVDGDGIANFVDADNDEDALPDAIEVEQGNDMNLVTPNVSSVLPPQALAFLPTSLSVEGTGFQSGLTVQFGSQTPAPSNLTATSFDLSVGAAPAGPVSITVTNTNGETRTTTGAFSFVNTILHGVTVADHLSFGVLPGLPKMVVGGLRQYGLGGAIFPLASNTVSGQSAASVTPGGAVDGLRCRDLGNGSCRVELLVDSDADAALEDETGARIETFGGDAVLLGVDLRHDTAGRPVGFYMKRVVSTDAVVVYDRDGDGSFGGANEHVTAESAVGGNTPILTALALDSADRVAVAYYSANANGFRVAYDRNGDGDYADTVGGTPERFTAVSSVLPSCVGLALDPSDRLVMVYGAILASTVLLYDLSGDGDFNDAGESQVLNATNATGCDAAGRAGQPLIVAHNASAVGNLLVDQTGDGDFADAGETSNLALGAGKLEVELDGGSLAAIATTSSILAIETD